MRRARKEATVVPECALNDTCRSMQAWDVGPACMQACLVHAKVVLHTTRFLQITHPPMAACSFLIVCGSPRSLQPAPAWTNSDATCLAPACRACRRPAQRWRRLPTPAGTSPAPTAPPTPPPPRGAPRTASRRRSATVFLVVKCLKHIDMACIAGVLLLQGFCAQRTEAWSALRCCLWQCWAVSIDVQVPLKRCHTMHAACGTKIFAW